MRRFALHVGFVTVGRAGVGDAFYFCGLFGRTYAASAVVALFFHVVVFRQWWNQGGAAGELADLLEDDFSASVVELDGTVDFDNVALEAAHIADIFQIGREDHDGEWAGSLLGAEVDEVDATGSGLNVGDFAGDALGFAYVLRGLVDGQAVGSEDGGRGEEQKRCNTF